MLVPAHFGLWKKMNRWLCDTIIERLNRIVAARPFAGAWPFGY
jgi:hypothetical protein